MPLGDSAWLCVSDDTNARASMLALRSSILEAAIPEITDVVLSYQSLAVYFEPSDGAYVGERLMEIGLSERSDGHACPRTIEIPTDYLHESSELGTTAAALKISPNELIERHSSPIYEVAALGFSPGFPYLLGLDATLTIPRKSSPSRVPRGAVAIAGSQAGIYPNASPGGWHVIGITHQTLFDPAQCPPALLRVGDRVKFIPCELPALSTIPGSPTEIHHTSISVIHPGAFASIQDPGRCGYRSCGVTAGGAADPVLHKLANLLVGNSFHEASIECAGCGPVLRFHDSCTVAWMGWTTGSGRPHRIHAGETLDLRSKMNASYGYIAVTGGLDVPAVLGSRACDVRAGFGGYHGRKLEQGDGLAVGATRNTPPTPGPWHVSWPMTTRTIEIRYLPGVQRDWFCEETLRNFHSHIYRKSSTADRTGIRLDGPRIHVATKREMTSQPVVPGSIQIPPDGMPIVLMNECQTIGGYPQIGHVISADLPQLARAMPGSTIRFREVVLEEARSAWKQLHNDLSTVKASLSLRT